MRTLNEALAQDRDQCVQDILRLFGSRTNITRASGITDLSPDEKRALLDVFQSVRYIRVLIYTDYSLELSSLMRKFPSIGGLSDI